jgi:hypothetical protein
VTSGKTAGTAVVPSHAQPTPAPAPRAAVATPATRPAAPEAVPVSLRGVPAPAWHVGDQWSFRWESAQGQAGDENEHNDRSAKGFHVHRVVSFLNNS